MRRAKLWAKIFAALIPGLARTRRKKVFSEALSQTNFFHHISLIAIVGLIGFAAFGVWAHGADTRLDALLRAYASVCALVGSMWIGAGVIYQPPDKISSLDELTEHVATTFSVASRHCSVGASIVLASFTLQWLSEKEWIKALDPPPLNPSCIVFINTPKGAGEAERIKCVVRPAASGD